MLLDSVIKNCNAKSGVVMKAMTLLLRGGT